MKNEIYINNIKYLIVENYNDAIEKEILCEKITDFFENYDYIVGDWAYGNLRLKGFNEQKNKNFSSLNDYNDVMNYLSKYCAYGCKYFILKKISE